MLGFSGWQLLKGLVLAAGTMGVVSLALIYFIPSPPSSHGENVALFRDFLCFSAIVVGAV